MKILVTGALGQLGRELREVLETSHPGMTVYASHEELDITDSAAVSTYVKNGEFSHIVNCAAYTAVDHAESEPAVCNKINSEAVKNLAIAAETAGARTLHISTDYVFDGKSFRPYRESDKVNPTSTYGTSKRKGEMLLLTMCPDAIIIRTSWLYSPYGKNFVKTMLQLGKDRESMDVVYDQIGSPTYARDLANAITTILFARKWHPGIYHYANEGVCSWYDFAKSIHRIAEIDTCQVRPILSEDFPSQAKRPHFSVFDKTLIKKTYGICIPHWEDSLSDCISRIAVLSDGQRAE
ncbi:MAG: dTDP-4-dehydrorhamnose reductase [Paramuribaculum sp.]|nr:dTDP-4-dehydrorhamnose reductase [Paramuribaculum sp.]MDE6323674.1 dTDP-4-dehydrorhamnose reductase [Paramuribaculum sp.]